MTTATIPPLLTEVFGRCHEHPVECTCKDCKTVLDASSEHEYRCRCPICKWWWARVPAEDDGVEDA